MQRCRKKRRRRLTEYYDDKKYNLAYERCIGVMAKLVQKYGVQVLEKEEKKEKESEVLSEMEKGDQK